jgi:phosphatidylglycerol:prolipoprotein diacylglycerol transferase
MPAPPDPILVQLGPFVVRWYGLLIVSGALLGAYVATVEAKRRHEDPEHVWNLLIWCLIFGIIGSRLYHVLSSPPGASRGFHYYFVEQPFTNLTLFGVAVPFPSALLIWEGGVGIFGALLGGILAVYLYTRRHQLFLWRWLDIAAPGMILAQSIGRWGNWINQELYGPPTTLPWGITITDANQRVAPYNDLTAYPLESTLFHPVFLYESLWSLLGFALLLWIGRKYADKLLDGDIFSLYLCYYPLGRIFIEMLRPDAWTLYGIAAAQIVSLVLIGVGVGLGYYRRQHPTRPSSTPSSAQTKRRRPAKR